MTMLMKVLKLKKNDEKNCKIENVKVELTNTSPARKLFLFKSFY